MNAETKRLLRQQWPHIAEDLIAVDEAADKWLKWRADLYRRKKEKRAHERAHSHLPSADRPDIHCHSDLGKQ
jgi:hypothetical protein